MLGFCEINETSKSMLLSFTAEITCHSLGSLDNGHIDVTDMRYGARARYQCNVGYRLEGPSFRSCLADGTWSDETPSCPGKTSSGGLLKGVSVLMVTV